MNVNDMLKVQPGDRIEMIHHSQYDIEPGAKGYVTEIRDIEEDLEMNVDDWKWVYVDWDKDWGEYSDHILIYPSCEDRFEILE